MASKNIAPNTIVLLNNELVGVVLGPNPNATWLHVIYTEEHGVTTHKTNELEILNTNYVKAEKTYMEVFKEFSKKYNPAAESVQCVINNLISASKSNLEMDLKAVEARFKKDLHQIKPEVPKPAFYQSGTIAGYAGYPSLSYRIERWAKQPPTLKLNGHNIPAIDLAWFVTSLKQGLGPLTIQNKTLHIGDSVILRKTFLEVAELFAVQNGKFQGEISY